MNSSGESGRQHADGYDYEIIFKSLPFNESEIIPSLLNGSLTANQSANVVKKRTADIRDIFKKNKEHDPKSTRSSNIK